MPRRRIWEVDIDIIGPITIMEDFSFKQEKGYDTEQFYSNIALRNKSFGISATLTAYADNIDIAKTVAFVFLGRMVDVLILDNDLALTLQEHGNHIVSRVQSVARRQFTKDDFELAFKVARKLEQEHRALLKAIGWFSKGKISNNTLDSFLSYWNVIEIVGKAYHSETERTNSGVINMVYQCFLDHFGDENSWDLPERWINNMHDKRSSIAHGGEEATSEAINEIAKLIPLLSHTARKIIIKILDSNYPEGIWHIVERERWMDFF